MYEQAGRLTEFSNRQWEEWSWTTRDGSHLRDFLRTARANRWWLYPDALAMTSKAQSLGWTNGGERS